ncbi:hypothetical protein FF1_037623 [Malus domestica]
MKQNLKSFELQRRFTFLANFSPFQVEIEDEEVLCSFWRVGPNTDEFFHPNVVELGEIEVTNQLTTICKIHGRIYVVPRPPVLCINIWRRRWESTQKTMLVLFHFFIKFHHCPPKICKTKR